ncbi:hypothetical protein OEK97_28775, partial [Escherichia coli]|uniref:hypothetical protein n=1 Tax=Escherichia coli TaxID=562 RepID=UPI0021D8F7B7
MRTAYLVAALAAAISTAGCAEQAPIWPQPSGAASSSATPAQPIEAEGWRASRLIDQPAYGEDGN